MKLSKKRFWLLFVIAAFVICLSAPGMFSECLTAFAYTENYHAEDEGYIAPLGDGEFSLVVIGDTQDCINVEERRQYIRNSNQWIVDNAERINLSYVVQVGDLVNDVVDPVDSANPDVQWQAVGSAFEILDDAKIPQAISTGNHDYLGYKNGTTNREKFDEYFSVERYSWLDSMIGTEYDDSIEQSYHYFTAGGTDYMLLVLGYKPTNDNLEWADKVVKANPGRQVIVVTHSYLYADGTRDSIGNRMWEKLIYGNENIFMVLCGHRIPEYGCCNNVSFGANGHPVQEIMCNMQYFEDGGKGNILLMSFRKDGTVDCNIYNPTLDQYVNDPFKLDLRPVFPDPMDGRADEGSSGNSVSGDYSYNYTTDGDYNWRRQAYAYYGTDCSESALRPTGESGYVSYKIEAEDCHVFYSLSVSFTRTTSGGRIQVYVSDDGEKYSIYADYSDPAVSKKETLDFTGKALNKEYFCVKLVLTGDCEAETFEVVSSERKVIDKTDAAYFEIRKEFSGLADYDVSSWSEEALEVVDLLTFGGYLGTGKQSSYAGAEGYMTYRFAAENKTIDSLRISLAGKLTGKDKGYALRIQYSLDNGETYTTFAQETVSITNFSKTYDLTGAVAGAENVLIRIYMYGDYWHSVGLKEMLISGAYRFGISYEYNGGEEGTPNPTSYTADERETVLASPTEREHYTFMGWYADEAFTRKVEKIPADVCGSVKLYAKWQEDSFRVIYNLGGGKNGNNPDTVYYSEKIVLQAAARNGYTFAGWYESADFSGEAVASLSETCEDVELYAKFLKNYRITYVLGGGELSEKTETFTAEDEIPLPVPTREGYRFLGWYTEKTFEHKIEKIERGTEAAVMLYAKWEKAAQSVGDASGSEAPARPGGCKSSLFGPALPLSFALGGAVCIFVRKKRG